MLCSEAISLPSTITQSRMICCCVPLNLRALGPLCAFPAIIPNSDTPMNTISRLEGEAEGKAAEHGALLAVNTTISMEGESIKGNHFEEREGDRLEWIEGILYQWHDKKLLFLLHGKDVARKQIRIW